MYCNFYVCIVLSVMANVLNYSEKIGINVCPLP